MDLGSSRSSFDVSAFPRVLTICADIEIPPAPCGPFVQSDAARLPFSSEVFDAVICNHSLEHFSDLDLALHEISRVLKHNGALFASVPDASTLTDRLYRKLLDGGGHVNLVSDIQELIARIESATGLRHRATRLLITSLVFLNVRHPGAHPTLKRLWEFGLDTEPLLVLGTWALRKLDGLLGTRMSVYGWALYFGTIDGNVDETAWANVCARCGSAHAAEYLLASRSVRGKWLFQHYACPNCGALNAFTRRDEIHGVNR